MRRTSPEEVVKEWAAVYIVILTITALVMGAILALSCILGEDQLTPAVAGLLVLEAMVISSILTPFGWLRMKEKEEEATAARRRRRTQRRRELGLEP